MTTTDRAHEKYIEWVGDREGYYEDLILEYCAHLLDQLEPKPATKSLKFDRVGNLDYLSAYEVIEKLVELFGVNNVQGALNEITSKRAK
jgi:hypothetical protein